MKKNLLFVLFMYIGLAIHAQKAFQLTSPDGRISTHISIEKELSYDITLNGRQLLAPSPLSMTLSTGETWGKKPLLWKSSRKEVKEEISSPFYRSTTISNCYNMLTLSFKGDWAVEFRAYNDGIAYRFISNRKKIFEIKNEEVKYRFDADHTVTTPYVARGTDGDWNSQFHNSFENTYTIAPLSQLNKQRLSFLPLLIEVGEDTKLAITESDLCSYPGLYLKSADGEYALEGMFAAVPKQVKQGGHNELQLLVEEREEYIARVNGARAFPWRIAIVANEDKTLAETTLVYQLGEPSRLTDISWIKPGKVAWEWWNAWNLGGVDFKTGINNATYKAYIDFAAQNNIEYVILDEGWAVNKKADLMQVVPEIDLPELVAYGKERSVGLILWAGYYAFDRDMENVCRHYAEMGIKGFKIDFMDRDDQVLVDFIYRACETCAKYKLIADLHGMYKPTGLNRTFPNVLNFEGVNGLEQMKWSANTLNQVEYDVQIPFIRQLAGPMDYTQGAMLNAVRSNYYPCNSEPMSQGTRCHQLALYMIFDSPFNMLCDSPTHYKANPECTSFIVNVPTTWDETRILQGVVGEYIVTARRLGDTWYIGGATDWNARDLTIDLSFLETEQYQATLFCDGTNAHRKGSDYKEVIYIQKKNEPLKIHLAPGGGFALKLEVK
ncbi:MAG: glycoside hydrolase family 97 protein [Bacteroides sp.]|nr:glycoside hydrolase family 97 protein [Bacteroides sp.]